MTITVRACPTATHTSTATPTPRATGTLRASRTSITVGGSTRVTGTSSAAFKFRIGSGLSTRSACGASGQSEVSGQASSTITLYGCRAGSYTVRLLTTSNREMAKADHHRQNTSDSYAHPHTYSYSHIGRRLRLAVVPAPLVLTTADHLNR